MLQIFDLQREIYAQFGDRIKQFALDGGWFTLLAMLPMGVVFGAIHALTPGHSKAVLAAYVAGAPIGVARALVVSLALSFTHVTMAVLIGVFSLPLVSIALGNAGRAPALENLSRALLVVIGLWMLWRALRDRHCHRHEGEAVGFVAGLVPCPLTLFVMTLAISREVPVAGIFFAVTMMAGVAITLSSVAVLVALARSQAARLLERRGSLLAQISRVIEGSAGVVLIAVALLEIVRR